MVVYKLKKYLFIAVLILGFVTKGRAEGNLPYVDEKLIHFGFLLGMNALDFKVSPNENARVSKLEPGFTVGIISDLRLNRYLNLRFTPTLHFGERELKFPFKTGEDSVNISSVPICFPVYLKYSAERKGNYRPYVIWGGGISYDLSTAANADNPVTLKPINFYTEFGVGCDIYFSFFKLAPELKYSIGFNDILVPGTDRVGLSPANQKFSNALYHLTSRMLILTFNFE